MKYFIFLIIITYGCYSKKPEKTGLEGTTLPSFNLQLADSMTYINTKDIKTDKPIVLFYYGPNCPYSQAQMEEIIDNMSILKNIQFIVFTRWPFKYMKSFNTHYELNKFSNIITGTDYKNFFADYFKVQGVPYIAIYGQDKKLIKTFIGNINGKQIKNVTEE